MASPRTIRLNEKLDTTIDKYLKKNRMKFSQLVSLALERFVSEPQTVTFVPADTEQFVKTAEKALKRHKHAMDKLR